MSELEEKLAIQRREFSILQRSYSAISVRLDVLKHLLNLLVMPYSRREKLEEMMNTIMQNLPVEAASIAQIDKEGKELSFIVTRGSKAEEVKKFKVKVGQGIIGWVAQERKEMAVSDVNKEPRFYQEISKSLGFPTRSILCVPIVMAGNLYGAIEIINKIDSDVFTPDERELLREIADFVGILYFLET